MSEPIVFVVDDDLSARRGVARLLTASGFRSEAFSSAEEFLARGPHDGPACLVLDLQMPGIDGLELQRRLREAGHAIPIVFLTGHANVPSSVQAMKRGAVDFLLKPFGAEDLIAAVTTALARSSEEATERDGLAELEARQASLSPRERQVMELVVTGLLNKQVAARLGTSEKTVKVHRARVMEKMAAGSLAELVRMAGRLGLPATPPANPGAAR